MAIFTGKFERVVFIVSSGRTGTTALATHLDSAYDNVRALHEPKPSWRLRRASARSLCGRMSKTDLVKLLAGSRRRLVESIDKAIYIESNPFLGGFLDAFGEVFPNPKIVHVVRDPRSFIRSSVNFGTFAGLKNFAQSLIPYWLPKPEMFAGKRWPSWREMDPAERLAWYWAMLNTELNRGEAVYGSDYLRVRFEDLFAADGSGLRRLTDWIGLPPSDKVVQGANAERVNASTAQRMGKWEEWEPSLKDRVLRHCAELMRLYGYREDVVGTASAGVPGDARLATA